MEFKVDYIVEDIQSILSDNSPNVETSLKKLGTIIQNLHASDQALIFTKLKNEEKAIFVQIRAW